MVDRRVAARRLGRSKPGRRFGRLAAGTPDEDGGSTMGRLRVLDASGDSVVIWDAERARDGDPEALAALREAERIVAEQRARGAQAFRVRPGEPAERLDTLDPAVEEVLIIPPVVGG
jgi:hypothetical protein